MVINMQEERLDNIESLEQFLAGTAGVSPLVTGGEADRQAFVQRVLDRFQYARLARRDKGVVVRYLERMSGYSRQHLVRLIGRFVRHTPLGQRRAPVAGFYRRYTEADVRLLAHTDTLHDTPSGLASKCLFERAWQVYGDARYERLAGLSVAHLYNLRASPTYQQVRVHWQGTRAGKAISIGVRRAPRPEGRAGFIRIDSVHQGDHDGFKGVYHINAVDCVTQWEVIATCEKLSEAYRMPVLAEMLAAFPFRILGVHADNGSEYINHRVASLRFSINSTPNSPNPGRAAPMTMRWPKPKMVLSYASFSAIAISRSASPPGSTTFAVSTSILTSISIDPVCSPRCTPTHAARPSSATPRGWCERHWRCLAASI